MVSEGVLRGSMKCRQSWDVTLVVHTLMQDANDVDAVCRMHQGGWCDQCLGFPRFGGQS
jgi:hypothetical protein